jgi:hypothetical protein
VLGQLVAVMTMTLVGAFGVVASSVEAYVVALQTFININARLVVLRRQLEAMLTLKFFVTNQTVVIKNITRWTEANGVEL